jgi:hypothetical protein
MMDIEIRPPVAKKQTQLSIANFFGGANNARPSINAEVECKTPTPNYVDQDWLVPTHDQDIYLHITALCKL